MHHLDKVAFESLIFILWNSWNNRNNLIFKGKDEGAKRVWENTKSFSEEFRLHNLNNSPLLPKQPTMARWQKPMEGCMVQ